MSSVRAPGRRLAWAFFGALLGGCAPYNADELVASSLGEPRIQLPCQMPGVYTMDSAQVSFVLTDLTTEQLESGGALSGRVLHVDLLWLPKAGKSPIDPEAINTTIRLLVFAEGEVGLYGGGGFAWPHDRPGEAEMELDLVGSNLTLMASSPGFHDLLSPAQILGRIDARYDAAATRSLRRAASQRLTNDLKQVLWVGEPMAEDVANLTAASAGNALVPRPSL